MTIQHSSTTQFGGGDGQSVIKQAARDAATRAQQSTRDAVSEARHRAAEALEARRRAASDRLSGVADAIRQTAQTLHDRDENAVARLAEQAADGVDRASGYLRRKTTRDLMHDAECLARDHPAICLGSAFVVGALMGRLLRASRHHAAQPHDGMETPGEPLAERQSQREYASSISESSSITGAGSISGSPSSPQGFERLEDMP
jgi:ElaB/YqjD/DUF883 family membrane-anchored ribosome-binding protein